MENSTCEMCSTPNTRLPEAFDRVPQHYRDAYEAVVIKGEPIPMDVAVSLMREGVDVEKYEAFLERTYR